MIDSFEVRLIKDREACIGATRYKKCVQIVCIAVQSCLACDEFDIDGIGTIDEIPFVDQDMLVFMNNTHRYFIDDNILNVFSGCIEVKLKKIGGIF